MRKRIAVESLSRQEVPPELDRRILFAASVRAAGRNRFRRNCRVFAAAASLLVAAGAVFFGYHEIPGRTQRSPFSQAELLQMGDWSALEQENYNLDLQFTSGRQALSELGTANE